MVFKIIKNQLKELGADPSELTWIRIYQGGRVLIRTKNKKTFELKEDGLKRSTVLKFMAPPILNWSA